MNIKIDFYKDWVQLLKYELSELGYSLPDDISEQEIPILYFNALRRRIHPTKRIIKTSKQFQCPENLTSQLDTLRNNINSGADLMPYLSRTLKKTNYDDDLLNDWGVYHLHLGTIQASDGFVNRTGPVLFALFTPSNAYEIQIYSHGNWSNRDVVEVVHENWPDLIARYKSNDIVATEYNPSSTEIKKLRDSHVNTLLQTNDGTVYAPIGGGMMTNGMSTDVMLKTNKYAQTIRRLEQWTRNNPDRFLPELKKLGYTNDGEIELNLEVNEKGMWAVCDKYNARFFLKNP